MTLAFGGLLALASTSTAYADVQLTLHDGRVSLVAKDATVRQILEAWAKIGQTKIVNVERITGGPVTLQFVDLPESTALEVLLRSVSGYVAAPRPAPLANASAFDRILVMPTSVAPAASASAVSAPGRPAPFQQAGPPQFQPVQLQQPPPPADDDQDDERPAPTVPGRSPVFNPFPQPQVINPQQGGATQMPGVMMPPQQPPPGQIVPTSTSTPGAPVSPLGGTSYPGVIVQPPPPQPGLYRALRRGGDSRIG